MGGRASRREAGEQLAQRAAWLPDDEHALIHAIFTDGKTAIEVAALMGAGSTSTTPRTLRRRIRRIVQRMTSPAFAYVALHRDAWRPPMRSVATACVLHGRPIRDAAARLGMPVHEVRLWRHAVMTLCETAAQTKAPTPARRWAS